MSDKQLPPPSHDEQELQDPSSATFWEHLSELRNRIVIVALTFVASFVVSWIQREWLFAMFTRPVKEGLARHGIYRLTALETTEAILVYLKMSAMIAVIATIPVALMQLWLFVKPGLRRGEIRPLRRVVSLSIFMFLIGLLFAYRFVLPLVVDFLAGFTLGSGGVNFQVTMKSAYSTAFTFMTAFGIVFELPLVMVLLAATPLISYRNYLRWIRYFVVLSFGLGSLLTPPDVISQILMAVPLNVLYLIGIGVSYLMERKGTESEAASKRPDFLLFVIASVLVALIVWLGRPSPVQPLQAMPEGAHWVFHTQSNGLPVPSDLPEGILNQIQDGGRVTLGAYEEGILVLLEGVSVDGGCDALQSAWNDPAGIVCELVSGGYVLGEPVPVARLLHNLEVGQVVPAPYSENSDWDWSVYRRVSDAELALGTYVIIRLDAAELRQEVGLAFRDPAEAEDFAVFMDGHRKSLLKRSSGQAAPNPTTEALVHLESSVRLLSAQCAPDNSSVQKELDSIRVVLDGLRDDEEREERGSAASCESLHCVMEVLADMLPEELEVVSNRRVLTLSGDLYGSDMVQQAAEDFLERISVQ